MDRLRNFNHGNHMFVRTLFSQPPTVLLTSMLGNGMLACTFALAFFSGISALPDCDDLAEGWSREECEWRAMDVYLRFDARAIMNIGHVGLLLIFMAMYWQGGKVYCFYSVKLSFLLMSSAAFGSTIIAIFRGNTESTVGRIVISLFLFVPSFAGLLSVSFENNGFRIQPSMSLWGGREEYLDKYSDRLEPGEGRNDSSQALQIAWRLHRWLLIMTALMIMEMAYSVFLVLHDPAVPVPYTFAAHADALVKAYTTMFHYTFVLATGYAAVTRLDDNCDMFLHGAGVFFLFDLASVVCAATACRSGNEWDIKQFGHCVALNCRLLPLRVAAKGFALYFAWRLRPHTLSARDRIPYAESRKKFRPCRLTLLNMLTYSYLRPPPRHHVYHNLVGVSHAHTVADEDDEEEGTARQSEEKDRVDGGSDVKHMSCTKSSCCGNNNNQEHATPLHSDNALHDIEYPNEGVEELQEGYHHHHPPPHHHHHHRAHHPHQQHRQDPPAGVMGERGGGVKGIETDQKSQREKAEEIDAAWLATTVRIWRVKGCLLAVGLFALVWLAECMMMVFVRYKIEGVTRQRSKGSLLPQSPMDLLEGFSAAENFGLHGAAFLAFHISLSYQSYFAYPLFRAIHFGSGSIFMSISVLQAITIPFTPAARLSGLFMGRAIACGVFCAGYFMLSPKTFRAHFALSMHAPLQHILDRMRRWKRRLEEAREMRRERQQEEGGDGTTSVEASSIEMERKQLGGEEDDSSEEGEGMVDDEDDDMYDGYDELKSLQAARMKASRRGVVHTQADVDETVHAVVTRDLLSFPGLGDGICEQERWMKRVIMGLTGTFLAKAIFQTLSSSGFLPDSRPFGAAAFPGIMLRAPGYDCAFHVPYLMTLFLVHGVVSGNLVALDVSICLSISLCLSCASRIAVLCLLWIEQGVMSTGWRIALGLTEAVCALTAGLTLQGSLRCVSLMRYCSSDPLRTWRR